VHVCALCLVSCVGILHATPENDFKEILLKEVSAENIDQSLINDVVEIRFNREFDKWKSIQAYSEIKNNNLKKFDNGFNYFGRTSIYAGVGSKLTLGLQNNFNEKFGYRLEISGINSSKDQKQIGVNNYLIKSNNASLGAYVDWFPFTEKFRISAGLNVNKIDTSVLSQTNSSGVINGKNTSISPESLDITYRFSKISPYIGLGYQSNDLGYYGWSSFVDVGIMIGRFDANTRTNLIGQNTISEKDISHEVDYIRNKLFHGNYIPTATIGLKYSY
jgi:hypothetical protein